MRNRIVKVLVAVVLAMCCSIAYAVEKSDITAGAKGIIADAKTKKPLKNQEVELFKVDKIEGGNVFFSGKAITSKTDKTGVFVFKNVPVGKYLIGVSSGIIKAAPGSYKKNAKKDVIEIVPDKIVDLGTILHGE